MKCICDNCKRCLEHPEGLLCANKMTFVKKDDTCLDWENDELFNPTLLIVFSLAFLAIVMFLSKIL